MDPMQNQTGSLGGLVPVLSAAALQEQARKDAEVKNTEPVLVGLAAYVRRCWEASKQAKQETEQRMLCSLRQRQGQYDPEDMAEIKKTGGSEIFMMITSVKCRAAGSWLKDILLGTKDGKSWGIAPTTIPDLAPEDMQQVVQRATRDAMEMEMMVSQALMTPMQMEEVVERAKDRIRAEAKEEAKEAVSRMEDKMEDQLLEGGYLRAISEFIDDLTIFPSAVLKGPVIRKKAVLGWVQDASGWTVNVQQKLVPEWERVSPFDIYPAPHSADIDDGYLIEHHRLTRSALNELIGVDGYSDDAIRAVLEENGRGGLREWLAIDQARIAAENKGSSSLDYNPEALIDALQFWGSVRGQDLIDWGMSAEEIPDPTVEYNCEVWQIGRWTIKATLNYDPLGRKPYDKTSYEEIPGAFWGNSVADLVRDCQKVCNSTARALVNNMGIASGPQVGYNVSRIPAGEDLTQVYPWKVWQYTSDPYGSTAPAMDFFQPSINAAELMGVYEKFSALADEYSGVPRYMSGDASGQGALRTSSGISMLMGNAGKAIKQVVANIDVNVTTPMLERQYYHNMRYEEDPELKGDVQIVARGANMLIVKEQAQVRRNEFLQIVASNPTFAQIVGEPAIAALLREGAKALDMDTDEIVPPPEVIRARASAAMQMAQLQMQAARQAGPQPSDVINFERDESGAVKSAKVMPGNRQQMQNGAPVTDNFAPARR